LESRIPIVVIGVGEHGKNHARALKLVEGAELAGVFDTAEERARDAARELGVRAFENLDEALAAARAVSVVIPTIRHAELAHKAFDRGVDVLLEKPITRTVEEADGLIQRAEAEKRILQVGHVERFNPGVVAAKAITKNPVFFEVHRLGVFRARSLDVDVVYDLMIHDLDLLLWMVDSPIEEVRAVGLPVLSDKVDIANVRVEFKNGTVANLTASRVSTEKVRKFRYFQPNEYISIDFARRDALAISVDREGMTPKIGFRNIEPVPGDPLQTELAAFVESVRTRKPPLVGGREGRAALALAAEVMDCIEEHAARVNLPLARSEGSTGEM